MDRLMNDRSLKKHIICALWILLCVGALAVLLNKEKIGRSVFQNAEAAQETWSLTYKNEILAYDKEWKTFYLPVDREKQGDSIKASDFGFSGRAGEPVFQEDWAELELMEAAAANRKFAFTLDADSEEVYYLTFTGLPILNIQAEGISEVDEIGDTPCAGSMSLQTEGQERDWTVRSDSTLRIRGGGSRNYPKKGYKLELTRQDGDQTRQNKKSLLGLRTDDEWILLPMYYDESKIRDKFSIDIWNSFGESSYPYDVNFGTRMEYLEVFINDTYMGLYGLLEPIDEKQVGISSSAEGGITDHLYKKLEQGSIDLSHFTEESGLLIRDNFEIKGKDKSGSAESFAPLLTYLELYKEKDDVVFCERAPKICSTDNVIDFWIQIQLIAGEDNLGKNYYCVLRMENGSFRNYFVPWDMDLTWGDTFVAVPEGQEAEKRAKHVAKGVDFVYKEELSETILEQNFLNRYIFLDVDGAMEKLENRWFSLRETVLSEEYLFEKIDSYTELIYGSGAMERNQQRWMEVPAVEDYTEFKNFVFKRLHFLDSYLGEE